MRRYIPVVLVASLARLSICALKTPAFQNPLSPEAISDAYAIATGDAAKRTAVFAEYTHQFGIPNEGPQIASIELETPFACVVDQIARNSANFHEPDAQEEFVGRPGEFKVQTVVLLTATWPSAKNGVPIGGGYLKNIDVHLKQGDVEVSPRSVIRTPIYREHATTGYVGVIVTASYEADKIKSGPITVTVTAPDNARMESEFDLDTLR